MLVQEGPHALLGFGGLAGGGHDLDGVGVGVGFGTVARLAPEIWPTAKAIAASCCTMASQARMQSPSRVAIVVGVIVIWLMLS